MMKLYAVRDRLLDYFQAPFVGPSDKQVMSSLATAINGGQLSNGIAQAPHQFELFALAYIEEDGTVIPEKQLLCDCSALRRDIREERESRENPLSRAPESLSGTTSDPGRYPRTGERLAKVQAPAGDRQGETATTRPGGATNGR